MFKRLIIITGEGKGKTTSAIGLLLRSIGHHIPCAFLQFIKTEINGGEISALRLFPDICKIHILGMGDIPPFTDSSFIIHQQAAKYGWKLAIEYLMDQKTEVIVLDDLLLALENNLLSLSEIYQVLCSVPISKNIIITGKKAPQELLDLADTVSEIISIKHASEFGLPAQKTIEF